MGSAGLLVGCSTDRVPTQASDQALRGVKAVLLGPRTEPGSRPGSVPLPPLMGGKVQGDGSPCGWGVLCPLLCSGLAITFGSQASGPIRPTATPRPLRALVPRPAAISIPIPCGLGCCATVLAGPPRLLALFGCWYRVLRWFRYQSGCSGLLCDSPGGPTPDPDAFGPPAEGGPNGRYGGQEREMVPSQVPTLSPAMSFSLYQ